MADDGDHSTEIELQTIQQALTNHRAQAGERRLTPRGSCHFCDDPVAEGHLFCDEDCRDDYDYEQQQRRRHFVH